MPGEIKHTWVGTTLIVESDSGTSGANLKGDRGDIGPRGPQGPAGVVYNADGEIIMEGYATEQFVQDMMRDVKVDLTGYATENFVAEQIANIPEPDLSNYPTHADMWGAISTIPQPDLDPYATKEHVAEEIAKIPKPDLTGYATEEFVEEQIANIPTADLTGYATEDFVAEQIAAIPQPDLTGYATEEYVDEKIDAIPQPDLAGYATEQYVDLAIEAISIPDLEDYATKDYVDITTTVALSNHYTKAEIDEALANLEPGTGGGGGGSSSNNAVLSLQNQSGWLYKIISNGAECIVKGTWSSLEDGLSTGNGVVTITVNNITKYAVDVPQGEFSINIAPYLMLGTNSVQLTVTDVYANTRTIIYNVEVVAATISSTFDSTVPYEGDIPFTYVPSGNVDKTVHFFLDGVKIGVQQTSASGRQQPFTIPAQKHGSHKFEVYFTANISGTTVESNHLLYDLICIESGVNIPIIACAKTTLSMTQFETINIFYSVYTPNSLTSDIELFVDGTSVKELTVDRTQQRWDFRADTAGTRYLKIKCGTTNKSIAIGVKGIDIPAEAETKDLELYLSSAGRSNSEKNFDSWTYKGIECEFQNHNWKSDGWLPDDNGLTVHRLTGDARLYIPFNMFENDARDTGKTIEIEFATRDTLDYDAVIASCMSEGVGFEMTAQKAMIRSEQAAATTQYKEDEHIRLAFVIEKKAENRLIYTYLNGIMCGAVQYADNDNFAQLTAPVGITLGSNFATLDIYTIRVYSNNLTRHQVLDNWIADTQDITERFNRYKRNNIYDSYGNIIIANLPKNLPYLLLEAPALPEAKGNEVIVRAQYVDPMNADKSFAYDEAIADVQGTSSAGYVRKNYIIEYPETYKLREDSIPTNVFTYKADVASSEGANNVELVRLYDAISPFKTPPQASNPSVRQGIDGFPIVIFHDDGLETKFIGKYNFNNDKKTPEVFGFAPGDESWEIRNNTSNRVLFKSADFEGSDWLNDFEARYPKGSENAAKLAAFAEWVVSTDTTDCDETEKAARLEKFKTELADHAEVQSALFYYLFTELFLMVDSRAKNAFPTFFNGNKVCWLPYDMDTAMGINNEGSLAFGYELEDTDHTASGADVYNGQKSVFWNNLRDTYGAEIKAMYQKLRSDKVLTYDIVEKMFEDHQTVWPEAIWNEDAWYKYLQPLVENNNGSYLGMLQGNKEEQRKWWLYNRFRYMDSKYNAGDAETDFITLRGYEKDDITIEPYADIYATIKYGSYLVQERALRGSEYTLECPMDTLNDTEIYIYSSSQLRGIGDLSGLKVGYADFASATKLQSLKLGDAASTYTNSNLTELYLGNNTLLQTLDVRNCPMLGSGEKQQSVSLSGCANIEHVYFDGTTIKGCALPNGGILKTLHLPATITNLTILNQKSLTDLSIPNYSNISTLRLENVNETVDMEAILRGIKAGSRVRLIGINWNFEQASEVEELFDILDTMKGLDENDKNMAKAQISGTIHIPAVTSEEFDSLKSRYPTVTITYDSIAYTVHYVNYDGSELYSYAAAAGTTAIDPVATGKISTPTKPATTGYASTFTGWDELPVITGPTTITAQYKTIVATYTVTFKNGGTTLQTTTVNHGQSVKYTGTTPVASAGAANTLFAGWYPLPQNVTSNMTCNALFASETIERKQITDSWDTVLANIDNGSYATKYKRGNYVTMDLGENGKYDMQIIGFNCDELPGGGYAPITWLSRNIMPTKMSFDSTSNTALWNESTLRAYLNSTVYSVLPDNIKSRVVDVKKTTYNGVLGTATSVDKLWIPDYIYEMTTYGSGKNGIYYDVWNDGDLDICFNNYDSSYCDSYWTRSNAATSTNDTIDYKYRFMKLYSYANTFVVDHVNNPRPLGGKGVRFGFCT